MRVTSGKFLSIWVLGLTMGLSGCDSGDASSGGVSGSASGGAPGGGGASSSAAGSAAAAGANGGTAMSGAAGSAVSGQSGAGVSGGGSGASGSSGAGQTGGAAPTGGTASSGGSGGSGGVGGASGGSSPCAGKTYKLCEDFEGGDGTTLPAGWTSFKGYGDASPQDQTITSAQFHSGAKALQSNSAQKGISRIQKDLAALGATASKHWGRIFYKVKSPAAKNPSNVLHVTFLSLMGTTENRVVDIVEQQNSNVHQWLFNNPNDQGGKASSYDWTFDGDWHCAEWFVDVGAKSYRFFSDAEEVEQLAFTGQDNQMSDYKSIIVGATHYQSDTLSEPFVVWFDDLAIDDAQVGCK
jgi:hypothetical protein